MIRMFMFALLLFSLTVSCGDSEESLAAKAGDKVGQAITGFAGGLGKGVDKQLLIKVELSKKLAEQGLTVSVSKRDTLVDKTIILYLIAAENFDGKLLAKAFNKDDLEIGRCVSEVTFAKDEAKYVRFTFNEEMDTQLVKKYYIDSL